MRKLFVLLFIFSCRAILGQTVLENNPPGIRWYQVISPHFQVLYPDGFEVQAQRMANTLEHIREPESASLGSAPPRISVILQNQSSVSNGFVSVFPRRSEFYAMPSQDYNFLGTNDWLNLLAAHEYRHVVQYHHAKRGFNKFLFYLFGNPTYSAMAHAAAPDWFWEGDAVAIETALTPGGRGKIPHFGLLFRTNLLEGRTFNYHKQYLRSYKHNIPNHYVFGYFMVSYLRRVTQDPDVWEKITSRSWSVPFIPLAFSSSIKREVGLSVTELYKVMSQDLQREWKRQIDTLHLTPFEILNERRTQAYTDYLYPQPMDDGSIIVRKEGIGDIQRFVRLNDGREETVFTPGFLSDAAMLSANNNVVVWNEFGFDPRWQVRNYSLIKAYDRSAGKRVVVSDKKARYGSASITKDGKRVVTIRTDQQYQHRLIVLSYPDGTIEKEFPNPENHFYSMPRWSDDGKKIVVLKTTSKGKSISLIDFPTGTGIDVLPVSNENVGAPMLAGDYLLFSSPASGIDNIHAIHVPTGKRYQVTSARYGAYNPAVNAPLSHIYYNQMSRNGMDVVRVPFDPAVWSEFAPVQLKKDMYSHLVEQEGAPELFSNVPKVTYPTRKYSRWSNVLNPFSWGAFVQNDLRTIDIGITSRDILSTTNLTAGYTYDLNEGTGFWRAGLSYQGLYPIIDLDFRQGKRSVDEGEATTVIVQNADTTTVRQRMILNWEEQSVSAGLRIPLITTRSKYFSRLSVAYNVGVTRVSNFSNAFLNDRIFPTFIRNDTIFQGYRFLEYQGNGTMVYNYINLSGSRLMKRSARDIVNRWGQGFDVKYYSTPFGGDFEGGVFSVLGYLYFPGIGKHHSIYGYASMQEMLNSVDVSGSDNDYFFRNTVPLPRGISVARFKRFYSSSVNYTMPLWYPDIAMGPILNLQRFRLNVFADYAFGDYSIFRGVDQSYFSVGGELHLDFNILRFLPQFDIGVRYSYGITPAVRSIELVVGTFNF